MKTIYRFIRRIYYSVIDNFINYFKIIKFKLIDSNKKQVEITDNKLKDNRKIIVSLTSIPSRFNKLHLCLETIMEQTMKPDKIILYLGLNAKNIELPKELIKMKKRGLEIEYREDKYLKPHTKYFYAMQEYPNDIIITFDDDILYDKNIIKNLYKSYLKYPNAVSCIRAHKITFTDKNEIEKYNNWKMEYKEKDSLIPNHYLCATGVGGVLYPPHCFGKETFNIENIKKLSLNQDDLWLKVMQIIGKTKVVKATKKNYHLYVIKDTQNIALCKANVKQCANDEIMKNLIEYYNIEYEDFKQE